MNTQIHVLDKFVCHLNGKKIPTEVVILPAGQIRLYNKPTALLTENDARLIISKFKDQGDMIPIDWEHATIIKGEIGEPAIAAGWITDIRWDASKGLIGAVEWTETAKDQIRGNHYKYLSPVFYTNRNTKHVVEIQSLALTNLPRIKNHQELQNVASRRNQMNAKMLKKFQNLKTRIAASAAEIEAENTEQVDGISMIVDEMSNLIASLGVEVAEGAAPEEVLLATMEFLVSLSETNNDNASSAEGEGETTEEVAEAIAPVAASKKVKKIASNANANTVPVSMYNDVVQRVKTLENKDNQRTIATRIQELCKEGKLNRNDTAQIQWAASALKNDRKGFEEIMKMAPVIVEGGQDVTVSVDFSGKENTTEIKANTNNENTSNPDREQVIATSRDQYRNSKGLQQMTSIDKFININLQEQNMQRLNKDEVDSLK